MLFTRPVLFSLGLAYCGLASAAEPMVPSLHLGIADAQGDFRNEMGTKHAPQGALSLTIPPQLKQRKSSPKIIYFTTPFHHR